MSKIFYFGIVLLIVVLDQATKISVNRALELYESIAVMPMFNITLAYNYGAAFSFLNVPGGGQRWLFTGISFVVSLALIVWLYRVSHKEQLLSLCLTFILGGAIGNLIDRAFLGYVVDFIQVYYDKHYFPTFNIADSAIFCGAVIMIYLTFVEHKKLKNTQK